MTITKRFTDAADRYVVDAADGFELWFRGGDDRLVTRSGTTTAYMGDGDDVVRVEGGAVSLAGQGGADTFHVYSGSGRINGGAGNDLFTIRGGSDFVSSGSTGNDHFSILTGATAVRLYGDEGADTFSGHSNAITGTLWGGAGKDSFLDFGNHEGRTVTLRGGTGNDLYRVDGDSPANIVEHAGEGRDTVQVGAGVSYNLGSNLENLTALGASTDLTVLGGNVLANRITGSAGIDWIGGGSGNDRLYGLAGDDDIDGGAGADRIYGGLGGDILAGDGGADVFVYESAAESVLDEASWFYHDWIVDFDSTDRIDLSAVDANSSLPGLQNFTFGDGDHEQGTIEIIPTLYDWIGIAGYIDGDDQPDFYLAITDYNEDGYLAVTEDSFILGSEADNTSPAHSLEASNYRQSNGEFVEPSGILEQAQWSQMQHSSVDYFST